MLRYQKVSLKGLGEFRETVVRIRRAKAVQKATDEDVNELHLILESIRNHLNTTEPKWDELIIEDTKFHLTLARVAGNRAFESVLYTVYDNINRYLERFLPREVKVFKGIYQDFFKITEAIESRDSNEAQTLLLGHVKRFNQMMKKERR